jgi:hypothetical protein
MLLTRRSWLGQAGVGLLAPRWAAAKNLSVTHLTNGCDRLDPVELDRAGFRTALAGVDCPLITR